MTQSRDDQPDRELFAWSPLAATISEDMACAREQTMERAISSGDPEKVSALLDSMDKAPAIRQLTGCYGGRGYTEDDNGLHGMTVPILHAAYTGNVSMFLSVHDAMRKTLRNQQVYGQLSGECISHAVQRR